MGQQEDILSKYGVKSSPTSSPTKPISQEDILKKYGAPTSAEPVDTRGPIKKSIDYVGGLSRASIAESPTGLVVRSALGQHPLPGDEFMQALKGNATTSAQYLKKAGVGEMGGLRDQVIGPGLDFVTNPADILGTEIGGRFLSVPLKGAWNLAKAVPGKGRFLRAAEYAAKGLKGLLGSGKIAEEAAAVAEAAAPAVAKESSQIVSSVPNLVRIEHFGKGARAATGATETTARIVDPFTKETYLANKAFIRKLQKLSEK